MVQTLIALMLVATQVLSWNAASVYLCVDADGTACFDFGPATCGCCHGEAAEDEHAGHACHGHDHALAEGDSSAPDDDCGCTHIQISVPHSATLVRATATPDDQQLALPLAILADTAVGTFSLDAGAGLYRLPAILPNALVERTSIVLRC